MTKSTLKFGLPHTFNLIASRFSATPWPEILIIEGAKYEVPCKFIRNSFIINSPLIMPEIQEREKTAEQQFLQNLKQTTLPQHEALERNQLSTNLMSPSLTKEQYLHILQRFYGFVVPVEEQVYPLLDSVFGNTDKFKRSALLREDLATFGMSPADINALPLLNKLPSADNVAAAFGIAYVLEGSKLGGQFISRHVGSVLGLSPENGLRFFAGHGRETGAIWNEFRHAMSDFVVSSGQDETLIQSAAHTFDTFKAWLDSEQV